jgi:cell division protein FtsB
MEMLRKNSRYIIIILGLALLVLLIRDFNSRMADLRRLTVEHEHISAEVTSLAATKTYLEEQLEYAQSDDAVRQWAYEQGKLAQPGDIVVVPIPVEGEVEEAEPTPEPEPEIVQNWQLWLALFVDPPLIEGANSP